MKIVFPEYENPNIKAAISESGITALKASSLEEACEMLKSGAADAMIAGIDHSTRDVILTARDHLGATGRTFTSSCYFEKPEAKPYLLADIAAVKNPTEDQLYDICIQTYHTAQHLFDHPKLALLSFSTKGSGGHDDSMTKIQNVVARVKNDYPAIKLDGEMQLDAALDPRVAEKKCPGSPVAGEANVLICPDLNTGNILYKAMEYFAGYHAAGPILQGFKKPISDLSRGSTVEDIKLTIQVMRRLCE